MFMQMEQLYEENMMKMFANTAEEVSKGDKEIEHSIKNQFQAIYNNTQDNKNIFYQAMLIMVYSYYETYAQLMCNELGVNKKAKENSVDSIFRHNNIIIPEHIRENKRLLYRDVRELRNFIVHNKSEKHKDLQDEAIKRLKKVHPEIVYDGEEIAITGANCVMDFLTKEYEVLKYLCTAVGFN